MRWRAWALAITSLLAAVCLPSTTVCAQTAPPSASPLPRSNEPLQVKAGEPIELAVMTAVSSETAKVDDPIRFEVIRPIRSGETIIVAEGATAIGRVTAAQKRGHRGFPGSLSIALDGVELVTGRYALLTGNNQQQGKDNRAEVDATAADTTVGTLGFGLPLLPIVLLEKGGKAEYASGTRVQAFFADDVVLDRDEIQQHQPPAAEQGIVYVIAPWLTTCGSMELPFDYWGGPGEAVVQLHLPPGQYWFHTGGASGKTRALFAGLALVASYGMASPAWASTKKVMHRPPSEFIALRVEAGRSYYLQVSNLWRGPKQPGRRIGCDRGGTCFQLLDGAEGEKQLTNLTGRYYRLADLSPEMLHNLQAEPEALHNKK